MDAAYMEDKSDIFKNVFWSMVETLQEEYPHCSIGWDGFIPIIIPDLVF